MGSTSARTWTDGDDLNVNTFSGDVTLRLPETARGDITFDSFSGSFNSDLPVTSDVEQQAQLPRIVERRRQHRPPAEDVQRGRVDSKMIRRRPETRTSRTVTSQRSSAQLSFCIFVFFVSFELCFQRLKYSRFVLRMLARVGLVTP